MSKYYRVGLKKGLSVKQIDPLAGRLTEAGHTGGASRGLLPKGSKIPKTHVTETRTISGIKMPVKYTKGRWKNWKKTKKQQYKRMEAFKAKE